MAVGVVGMISEPEMAGEGDAPQAVDLVSHTDRPPLPGRFGAKPWLWALGAVVVTSAVWAGVLQGTGYGRTAAPDLHGYRIGDSPCTNHNLQPLAGRLGAVSFGQGFPEINRSTALDHVSCQLIGWSTPGDGWTTNYTIAVTVDLHKKTDPAAEFDAASSTERPTPSGGGDSYSSLLLFLDDHARTSHPQGIGDRANLVTGQYRQSLEVRHGGAVFTLTLSGTDDWDSSRGKAPTNADGSPTRPGVTDTSAFGKDLVPTMRSLMRALTQPASSS
ncbi:hypothetical protein [Streptomyces sp. NPDC049040]|uniref:hypothetical protein n=1 Tax=Streptomyces sp. NPDC049040 TaxID=3365593 RepID=UPI003712239A